ncbi:MAG: efflux RND transporter permease subunit, partial [Sphingomonadales bacterium]
DIQIQLSSRFPDLLAPAVDNIRSFMADEMVGLADIEDDRAVPGIQWELRVDRAQASRFGADIVTVGNAVQLVTNGIKVGELRPDDADDEIDIRVRFPLDERSINQLDDLRVQTASGMVPIGNFVTRTPQPKVSKIRRIDGRRVMTVQANVLDGVLADTKVQELKAWLSTAGIDPRINIKFAGQDEDQREASTFLTGALLVALFMMAIILITQFNSFYHAVLILSAVVMSTVGVLLGLMITGRTFVIVMTGIGVISLAGIVVNNNIVLIDTYARLKNMGVPVFEAIVRTGAQRLRPVLLTTITTIIGLLPMVFSTNIDLINRQVVVGDPKSIWWVDLSMAIVFGLSFATILTLVVTPCLLAAPEVLREKFGRSKRAPAPVRQPAE